MLLEGRSRRQRVGSSGLLNLPRDAFNYGWIAKVGHETRDGEHNGIIIRVWVAKPQAVGV
jgi:hypothetical protein